jgi:hypothetical protein
MQSPEKVVRELRGAEVSDLRSNASYLTGSGSSRRDHRSGWYLHRKLSEIPRTKYPERIPVETCFG